jgi:hypothetical protein
LVVSPSPERRAAGAVDRIVGDGDVLEPTAAQRRAGIVCDLVKEGLHEVPAGDADFPVSEGRDHLLALGHSPHASLLWLSGERMQT